MYDTVGSRSAGWMEGDREREREREGGISLKTIFHLIADCSL